MSYSEINHFPYGSIGIKNLDRDVSDWELDLIHFTSIYIATKFQLFPKFLLGTIAPKNHMAFYHIPTLLAWSSLAMKWDNSELNCRWRNFWFLILFKLNEVGYSIMFLWEVFMDTIFFLIQRSIENRLFLIWDIISCCMLRVVKSISK